MVKGEHLETGKLGEAIAAKFLILRGWKIIERNLRLPFGEVDIVARKGEVIHFVEVKTVSRENSATGSPDYRPEELVHTKKLEKIRRVAEFYLVSREIDLSPQIDVVTVHLEKTTQKARCLLIESVE